MDSNQTIGQSSRIDALDVPPTSPRSTPTPFSPNLQRRLLAESNRKRVGFILLILVVLLWGGSSFLLQQLFTIIQYSKPLLTTVVQTSLTSLLLLPKLFQRWMNSSGPACGSTKDLENDEFICNAPQEASEECPKNDLTEHFLSDESHKLDVPNVPKPNIPNPTEASPKSDHSPGGSSLLCNWKVTATLGSLWFGGQVCFNLSLMFATVPTTIIISSTSIFFTYALMILVLNEKFDILNFLAMLTSFFGIGLIVLNTPIHRDVGVVKDSTTGYVLSLLSALAYAVFVVCLKQWFSHSATPAPPQMAATELRMSSTPDPPNMLFDVESNLGARAPVIIPQLTGVDKLSAGLHNSSNTTPDPQTYRDGDTDFLSVRSNPSNDDYFELPTERHSASNRGPGTSTKRELPKSIVEEELEMSSLFGSIGLYIASIGPVLILLFHFCSVETFEFPSLTAFEWMLFSGLFGTVLSNYLWGLTVVLLNPIVTTVGTNLQIPLVLLADSGILYEHKFNAPYITGSVMVVIGVIVVSIRTTRTC